MINKLKKGGDLDDGISYLVRLIRTGTIYFGDLIIFKC